MELDALRAAAYAAPEDDAPRLVLADYLLAQGDSRGELITVQCKIARGDRSDALLAREQELLELRTGPVVMGWERGFARAVLEADRDTPGRLHFLANEPLIERLSISRCGNRGRAGWTEVARIIETVLDRIRALELGDVAWTIPNRPSYLPFDAPFDDSALCAEMLARLVRPPQLAEVYAEPAELPPSWRR